ncbi:flagellar hook-basal body complex protein FliE 1 [Kordiimonas sediminis]|uniref:Flagellar hook-basal body complex protein FliE n=1 Tax=Kordiimonas sediminis TaxID=1735581 RepID=A0A919E7S9_9PROT|nr:flagellar hook-basal body complex protein FliE [Kordiimonas sediminis]GHF27069.1 flagellar hook-basal body complex protein FliE 1 [Kordiimonas sediminis]
MDIKQLDAVNAYGQASKNLTGNGVSGRDGGADGLSSQFADMVSDAVSDIKASSANMEVTSAKSLVNQADMVDVVTAVSNAELTVQTVVAVRDKVISAYNDILKMPI